MAGADIGANSVASGAGPTRRAAQGPGARAGVERVRGGQKAKAHPPRIPPAVQPARQPFNAEGGGVTAPSYPFGTSIGGGTPLDVGAFPCDGVAGAAAVRVDITRGQIGAAGRGAGGTAARRGQNVPYGVGYPALAAGAGGGAGIGSRGGLELGGLGTGVGRAGGPPTSTGVAADGGARGFPSNRAFDVGLAAATFQADTHGLVPPMAPQAPTLPAAAAACVIGADTAGSPFAVTAGAGAAASRTGMHANVGGPAAAAAEAGPGAHLGKLHAVADRVGPWPPEAPPAPPTAAKIGGENVGSGGEAKGQKTQWETDRYMESVLRSVGSLALLPRFLQANIDLQALVMMNDDDFEKFQVCMRSGDGDVCALVLYQETGDREIFARSTRIDSRPAVSVNHHGVSLLTQGVGQMPLVVSFQYQEYPQYLARTPTRHARSSRGLANIRRK